MIPLRELKKAVPIIEVARLLNLKIKSKKISCYNKLEHKHGDRHPSLVLQTEKNSYRCMACGEWGSILDLVMQYRGCEFRDSIDWVKKNFPQYGLDRRQGLLAALENAKRVKGKKSLVNPLDSFLDYCGPVWGLGEQYLVRERGLRSEVLDKLDITFFQSSPASLGEVLDDIPRSSVLQPFFGFSGDPFVVYPYRSEGETACLQGRRLGKSEPRFMNTGGDIPSPWNIDITKSLSDGEELWITEGVIDGLSLMSGGIDNVVSIPAAATFKEDWTFDFARFTCVICTDNDIAGKMASDLISAYLLRQGANVKIAHLPSECNDANSLLTS
tara:strand:- start:14 stop:997 length:984 start_codon:yes stop_codon:yes gene_type:complete